MHDTINIYWDGFAPMPSVVRNLPKNERTEVLMKVKERREELRHESPTPWIIGMAIILIFFVIVAVYPKLKARNKVIRNS